MAELVTGIESEILTFYDSEPIQYIQGIESLISNGNYVKLTNREYLFVEMSRAYNTEAIQPKPQKYGYINNTPTISLMVEYDEE